MRRKSEIARVTVDDGWVEGRVGVHERVDAAADSYLVCRDNYSTILTLLDGAYLADCCDENGTINARLDERILNRSINVHITLLAADDTEAAPVKIVRVQILIILHVNAFV